MEGLAQCQMDPRQVAGCRSQAGCLCTSHSLSLVWMQDASERAKMMLSWDVLNGVRFSSTLPKLVSCALLIQYIWQIGNNKDAVDITAKYFVYQPEVL